MGGSPSQMLKKKSPSACNLITSKSIHKVADNNDDTQETERHRWVDKTTPSNQSKTKSGGVGRPSRRESRVRRSLDPFQPFGLTVNAIVESIGLTRHIFQLTILRIDLSAHRLGHQVQPTGETGDLV